MSHDAHMGLTAVQFRTGRGIARRVLRHQTAHGFQGPMVRRDGTAITQMAARHDCHTADRNRNDRHEHRRAHMFGA
jgi:hypothetical protein